MARFRNWSASDIKKKSGEKSKPKEKKVNPFIVQISGWLQHSGIPFTTEWKFHNIRKWRFDFAIGATPTEILKYKIGIEFNGGVFVKGRHTRGMGYVHDMDKLNHAQLAGYRVLQYTNIHIRERGMKEIIDQVKSLMNDN